MDPKLFKYLNEAFRKREAIKLYREILKTAKMFTWEDERGVKWSELIKMSAREEFESSKQENDPEVLARAMVNAQMALTDLQGKFKEQQEKLKAEQFKKDEELKRNINMTRVTSKYE
eukprot:gene8386-211_t